MTQYTFLDICQQNNGIEIPIIQRDYAQGRIQETKKRERFLAALKKAVIGNGISLDFIYGSLTNGILIPLDGQQRLTTLFLLHWYAAKCDSIDEKSWLCLKKFTYATRTSAKRFCAHLLAFTPSFNTTDSISVQIRDEAWFPSAWENDPTIASMLQMLDDIAKTFNDIRSLWVALCSKRKITFCFETLENMGITDDIYIKMNSRGKPLTDFEHFKAELTSVIKQDDFNLKIDTDWTNLLWAYRGENEIIDEAFLAYFHFVSDIICVKADKALQNDYFKMLPLYNDVVNVRQLETYFDCWYGIQDIEAYFNNYFATDEYEISKVTIYDSKTNLFRDCCEKYQGIGSRDFSIRKILMLYAFIIRNTKGKQLADTHFRRRLRIVRNLAWNSADELRTDRMKVLLEEVESIILQGQILTSNNGFSTQQKQEEQKKLIWCEAHAEYVDLLFHLEDHKLLYGCIAIAELDKPNTLEKLRLLLNMDLLTVARALLTYQDYRQTIGRYKQIANNSEDVWKQMLHPSRQRNGFEDIRTAIATLLMNCAAITTDELDTRIKQYLQAAETPKDWRYYFIKYPNILQKPTNGKYDWESNYMIHILNYNTYRGYHWDAISLAIYSEFGKSQKMLLDNWNEFLTLASGKKLVNKYDRFIIQDVEGNTVHEEPIQQTDGIDTVDRVVLAKILINKY